MNIEVKNNAMLGRTNDTLLHVELIKLQQERDKYKSIIEGINNHIENCLENDKYCNLSSEPKDRCRVEIWGEVKIKLKELEEGDK